MTIISV